MSIFRRLFSTSLCVLLFATSTVCADEAYDLNIEEQELSTALKTFAEQSGLQVVYFAAVTDGAKTKGVNGTYSADAALTELLEETDLVYATVDDRTYSVGPTPVEADEVQEPGKFQPASSQVLMAQNQTSAQQSQTSNRSEAKNEDDAVPLEEIIVVGSHIRGAQSASPVLSFDRQDIDNSGYATLERFIESLPQNFNGGVTERGAMGISGEGGGINISRATGINLRGLGNASTLVLLNGRRITAAGLGESVDISMIPLAAVERIEIVIDGASAIYGSDAVGGVVNLIMRNDYEGAETRLRYGTVTDGNHEEIRASQTFGKDWASGNAVFNYTYFDRSDLDSADRSFTADAGDPTDLLPETTRHNALFSVSKSLSESFEIFGDVIYGRRDTDQDNNSFGRIDHLDVSVEQYHLAVGFRVEVSEAWQADLSLLNSKNTTDRITTREGVGLVAATDSEFDIWSFDGIVDGTLFHMPGGDAKVALGGHFRTESLNVVGTRLKTSRNERDVIALFAEVNLPIFGENNHTSGFKRLELTLAGRYEDYDDFGSTTDPKFGLLWSPIAQLDFRATWGTSFRAPLLIERSQDLTPSGGLAFNFPDNLSTDPSGMTGALFLNGNAFDIQPEEATIWSVGADFHPDAIPGLELSLTYFDIDYTNRIANPLPSTVFFGILVDEALYGSAITRNPSLAEVDFWLAQPTLNNPLGLTNTDIGAIADNRLTNSASLEQSGVDFLIDHQIGSSGEFGYRIAGTYLFERLVQQVSGGLIDDRLDTAYNPVGLTLRNSAYWNRKNLITTIFLNYVDSYKDIRTGLEGEIDSWTTVDLNFRYETSDQSTSILRGTSFSLNFQNLFDQDPPFVKQPVLNNDFDAANANAIGRYISLQLVKEF